VSDDFLEEFKIHTQQAYLQGNEDILRALIKTFKEDKSYTHTTKSILNSFNSMLKDILKIKPKEAQWVK